MAFWTSVAEGAKDPKRNFRFKVVFNKLDGDEPMVWWAKSVDKPNFSVQESSHKFLNHTYYFPARVEWQEISMKFVDPVKVNDSLGGGTVAKLNELFEEAGYIIPKSGADDQLKTQSKAKSKSALDPIEIHQIDSEGETVEKWVLHNPFIKKITYGSLAYDNDELTEIEIGLRYDWATCEIDGTSRFTTES